MIDELKPYQFMKDSGIAWLAQVPEHWEILRLKHIAKLQSGEAITAFDIHDEGEFPVFGGNGLRGYTSRFTHEGEFVLIGRQGALCGNIKYASGRFWASEHAVVVHPKTSYPVRWLGELLRMMNLNQYSIAAAQPGLSVERIQALPIPFPSPEEKIAISRFIEQSDRLVRRFINAKRKVIDLLFEQKQIIVQRAVTQGVDPNAPMKETPIASIGTIPKHWEINRGKYYFREVDERSIEGSEELMSVSHKTGVTARSEKNITMFMAESYAGHKLCRAGDIVVNTMWAWMAALGVANRLGIVSPSYGVYRPRSESDFRLVYLDLLLRIEAYRTEYVRSSRGITTSRLRLYPDDFLRLLFIRPPLHEQDEILRWIEHETADIQRAIDTANREMALLREWRARLIVDVVTGKVDVRDVATLLPEESSEAEPLDEMDDLSQDESTAEELEAEATA
jgi:type I restriction enzyme S subunit